MNMGHLLDENYERCYTEIHNDYKHSSKLTSEITMTNHVMLAMVSPRHWCNKSHSPWFTTVEIVTRVGAFYFVIIIFLLRHILDNLMKEKATKTSVKFLISSNRMSGGAYHSQNITWYTLKQIHVPAFVGMWCSWFSEVYIVHFYIFKDKPIRLWW